MLVKLQWGTDPADFQIVDDVEDVRVNPQVSPPTIAMKRRGHDGWQTLVIREAVYVMNDRGATIDKFVVPRKQEK